MFGPNIDPQNNLFIFLEWFSNLKESLAWHCFEFLSCTSVLHFCSDSLALYWFFELVGSVCFDNLLVKGCFVFFCVFGCSLPWANNPWWLGNLILGSIDLDFLTHFTWNLWTGTSNSATICSKHTNPHQPSGNIPYWEIRSKLILESPTKKKTSGSVSPNWYLEPG